LTYHTRSGGKYESGEPRSAARIYPRLEAPTYARLAFVWVGGAQREARSVGYVETPGREVTCGPSSMGDQGSLVP
jgi:hypothetical protein